MPFDADAARAARREAAGVAPSFTLEGRTFVLPVELPADVVVDMRDLMAAQRSNDGEALLDAAVSVMEHLLGTEFADFLAMRPSLDDFLAIIEGVLPDYGVDEGNSQASE